MSTFLYQVSVSCDTQEEADRVMAERIDFSDDYGFEYEVTWRTLPGTTARRTAGQDRSPFAKQTPSLSELDEGPAWPITDQAGSTPDAPAAPTMPADGAADVGGTPTPGSSVADYPAPSETTEPPVGETPTDSWTSTARVVDPKAARSFRQRVQAGLQRQAV